MPPLKFLSPLRASLHQARSLAALSAACALLLLAGLLPPQAQAQGPWIGAPGFAGGEVAADAHALDLRSPNQESLGAAIARVNANTIVQAALVKHPSGSQTNGLWNLGLLLFDSRSGVRLTWPSTSVAHGWGTNQYRVFPNSPTAVIAAVKQVLVARDTIFVLADAQFSDRRVASIYRFSTSGQYLGLTEPFSNSPQFERWAGDMQTYSSGFVDGTRLVVAGFVRNPATGDTTPLFRNYIVEASGALTDASGLVSLEAHGCSASARCQPEEIAFGFRGLLATPQIYIAGRVFAGASFENQRVAITKIGATGTPDPLWNSPGNLLPLGARTDAPGGVSVKGLVVRTTGTGTPSSPYADQVTVVAEVQRDCGWGVRVARILTPSNLTYSQVLFGGGDSTGALCLGVPPQSLFPRSAVRDGTRLIIAGRRDAPGLFVGERPFDSFVAQVDTGSMSVLRQDTLTWPLVGSRLGNSLINDVLLDGGALIGAGALRYPQAFPNNPALEGQAQSSRVRLVTESIFSDGFE